jgi:hypothetical protein
LIVFRTNHFSSSSLNGSNQYPYDLNLLEAFLKQFSYFLKFYKCKWIKIIQEICFINKTTNQCNNFISITKYQRNYQTTLEELVRKNTENATILSDYILAEENDINIKGISTKEWRKKFSRLKFVGN